MLWEASEHSTDMPESEQTLAQEMRQQIAGQGMVADSVDELFDDYLVQGMGSKPLVLIYEAQYLRELLDTDGENITLQMQVIYPEPMMHASYSATSLTPVGDEIAQALSEDAELQELAAHHGYRPYEPFVLGEVLDAAGIAHPPNPPAMLEPFMPEQEAFFGLLDVD